MPQPQTINTPPTLFKPPNTPAMPLFPVSPERVNKMQKSPSSPSRTAALLNSSLFNLDTSRNALSGIEFGKPSMGEDHHHDAVSSPRDISPIRAPCHSRANSDARVGGLVAQFESFDIRDRSEEQRIMESRYKRAQMGREIAENETKEAKAATRRLQEEIEMLRKEKSQLKDRLKDREEGEETRVQVLKEDHLRALEAYRHKCSQHIKQADQAKFAAESVSDELKIRYKRSRDRCESLKRELEMQRKDSDSSRSTAFKANYQREELHAKAQEARDRAAALETENHSLKTQLKEEEVMRLDLESRITVVESERDALKTSLQEEEVARIAAEGRLALPVGEDEEFDSPKKSPGKPRSKRAGRTSDKENLVPIQSEEISALQQELENERMLRKHAEDIRRRAEDQIDFMKMECQFECCSCRIAERASARYVHDIRVNIPVAQTHAAEPEQTLSPDSGMGDEMEDIVEEFHPDAASTPRPTTSGTDAEAGAEAETEAENAGEIIISFSPTSGTFKSMPSPTKIKMQPLVEPEDVEKSEVTTWEDAPEQKIDEDADEATLAASEHLQPEAKEELDLMLDIDIDIPSPAPATSTASNPEPTFEPTSSPSRSPQPTHHASTPLTPHLRTITTTTTIPIHFSPFTPSQPSHANTHPTTPSTVPNLHHRSASDIENWPAPNTIDKRAALEKIKERRNRARSVTMGLATPRRQMVAGGRRDVSAPAGAREWTGERR